MSVVIAIKHEGSVYFGADSQVTFGGSRMSLSNPNNYKIWKVRGVDNCLLGSVGRCRDANIIRLMDNVISELDVLHDSVNFDWVVTVLVPRIFDELRIAGYVKPDEKHMDSSFLFAYKDRLFEISSDGCVIEIDDFDAIGSGSTQAVGSLLSTEKHKPTTRIISAIKASAASDIYVDYPIVLANTSDCTFKTIYKEDMKNEKDGH